MSYFVFEIGEDREDGVEGVDGFYSTFNDAALVARALTASGHYPCHVLCGATGRWWEYDQGEMSRAHAQPRRSWGGYLELDNLPSEYGEEPLGERGRGMAQARVDRPARLAKLARLKKQRAEEEAAKLTPRQRRRLGV